MAASRGTHRAAYDRLLRKDKVPHARTYLLTSCIALVLICYIKRSSIVEVLLKGITKQNYVRT